MADLLNDYFVSVFTKESPFMGIIPSTAGSQFSFDDNNLSDDLVAEKLRSFSAFKVPAGLDGIHPVVLQECSDIVSVNSSEYYFSEMFGC